MADDLDAQAEIDELEAKLEAAREAVREQLFSGVAVGRNGGEWMGRADTPVDQAWVDRYDELKAAADRALAAANQAWDRWLAQRRGS